MAIIKSSAQRCEARVWEGHHAYPCSRNAKVERLGIHYCRQHDPDAIEARKQKRHQHWQREIDHKTRQRQRERAAETARGIILAGAYELRGQDPRLAAAFDSLMANSSWTPEDARALLAEMEN